VRNSARTWQTYVGTYGELWGNIVRGRLTKFFVEYCAWARVFLNEIHMCEYHASNIQQLTHHRRSIGSGTYNAGHSITGHSSLFAPTGNPLSVAGSFSPSFYPPSTPDTRRIASQNQIIAPNMPDHPITTYSSLAQVEPILPAIEPSQHQSRQRGFMGHAEATNALVHHEPLYGIENHIDTVPQEEYLGTDLLQALDRPGEPDCPGERESREVPSAAQSTMCQGSNYPAPTRLSLPPVTSFSPSGATPSSFSQYVRAGTHASSAFLPGVWGWPGGPTVSKPESGHPSEAA
jgi:hypothetical protein